MSKLLKLKEWLTVAEAAKHLSGILEEGVTEADVLRLALDGHMRLAINFVNPQMAKGWKKISISDARTAPSLWGDEMVLLGIFLPPGYALEPMPPDSLIDISGVWDLPLTWSERKAVEIQHNRLSNMPLPNYYGLCGFFVVDCQDRYFQLLSDWNDVGRAEGLSYFDPERYYPTDEMPDDAVFVVRTEALREFETSLNESTVTIELDEPRKQRIKSYVDKAYADGKPKTESFKELAATEQCGIENIKRIYYDKDLIG